MGIDPATTAIVRENAPFVKGRAGHAALLLPHLCASGWLRVVFRGPGQKSEQGRGRPP